MDHYGRKRVGMPAFLILSLGLLSLPWASSLGTLQLSALVMGLGNGLSSGFIIVLGGDVAPPPPDTGAFLGVFELFSDSGELAAPLCAGLAAKHGGLAASAVASGLIGLAGLLWYAVTVPETLASRRAAPPPAAPAPKGGV